MAKIKALISFAVTAKLICAFVFAYAKKWFTHERARIFSALVQERINNGSIIKSTRPAKFNTVYSAFFKQFPVVGKNLGVMDNVFT